MFSRHRKLIVAVVGLVAIIGREYFDLKVDDAQVDNFVSVLLAVLTAVGVERTPNKS